MLLLQMQLELQSSAGYAEVRGGSGVLKWINWSTSETRANFYLAIGLMALQCAKDCSKCS